jgi:hypothetical protein
MAAIKVGVREFRERISTFLESETPVAVTRRGETVGVYVPTRRKHPGSADVSELRAAADHADVSELRAAADHLARALADVDEEELVTTFKQMRRRSKRSGRR